MMSRSRPVRSSIRVVAVMCAALSILEPAASALAAEGSDAAAVWTVGTPDVPRVFHAATPLADGRVLVTGGVTQLNGETRSAELYDPAAGEFSPASDMNNARSNHTATPLADGRVLVAGGADGSPTAEVFDPATGAFSPTGPMQAARSQQRPRC